jgi:acetolactate synthase-1/2/3 large subunit
LQVSRGRVDTLNGAERLLDAAAQAGIDTCFANPGTTELPLVAALDSVPIRPILGLAEGVCTGAADGYGRMVGRPALTILHLAPGLGNGLSNLHNARRARTPVVNVVGEHANWHVNADPPLAGDIHSIAASVSSWVRTVRSAPEMGPDMIEAATAARLAPGVATLIVPADCQWSAAGQESLPSMVVPRRGPNPAAVKGAADALRQGGPRSVLMLGGTGLTARGLLAAGRIARATGCRLMCARSPARLERGPVLPSPIRAGYYPDQLANQFTDVSALVLAGEVPPVPFFAEPGQPSRVVNLVERVEVLAEIGDDIAHALEALADEIGPGSHLEVTKRTAPALPSGGLEAETLGPVLAALQPEGAIVVDESITLVRARNNWFAASQGAPPHTLLTLTGGSLGMGIPCAVGAAVACPDRPVVSLQADGSAVYTIQGLWTQARESLNVTTVLISNRRYQILRHELARAGVDTIGAAATELTDLSRPDIDFVALARGFGVPGVRCETIPDLVREFRRALAQTGPSLIEVST